jgi:hypothetical protein
MPRRSGQGVRGTLAAGGGQPGPASSRAIAHRRGPLPAAPMPRAPPQHAPAVTLRGCPRSASWQDRSSHARCAIAGERSQAADRNAAHCTGRPLHTQGHSKILSSCSAKTAPQKASSGPTLVRGATADPAGLTAGARPEARPHRRAAKPPVSPIIGLSLMSEQFVDNSNRHARRCLYNGLRRTSNRIPIRASARRRG